TDPRAREVGVIGPFRSILKPVPPLAGRCSTCGKLTLRAEPETRDASGQPPDRTWLCAHCGSRFRRRYGQRWEKVPDGSGVTWLDVVDPPAPPLTALTPRRTRFKIRDVMIVVALFALDIVLVGRLRPIPGGLAFAPPLIGASILVAGQLW